MATGIALGANPDAVNLVDDMIFQATRAYDLGVQQVWLSQQFNHDAIALAGLIGAAVPGLGVGTAAVPINPRHPLIMASLAQTAQAASHGNFSLGLALGGHEPERHAFGMRWPNTIQRLREHLTILRAIFDGGDVDFHGEELNASPPWPATVAGGAPIPIYVAALGPKSLRLTAELADGTLLFLAGPRTIEEFIEPTIAQAAAEFGQPKPRLIASVPTVLSEDGDAARTVAAEQLGFYETVPSYQRVIAREGIASVADLAAAGPAESIVRQLRRYLDAGATDLVINPFDQSRSADLEALWRIAASL